MDYDINLTTLDSKKSEFETMESAVESLVSSYNSSYLNRLSGTEISTIASQSKELMNRLKKGYNNSNTWLNNYLKGLNELENNLSNFSDDSITSPVEFEGEFIDLFGKRTIPVLQGKENPNVSLTTVTTSDGVTVVLPTDLEQTAYTVTGYDYWIDSGREMVWASGTNQRAVSDLWKSQGSNFKNGIATINVDGVDRYLIAVTPTFGTVGDCVDVNLADGTTINCIIGDSKGSDAGSEWGHVTGSNSVNVLEFEVQRSTYQSSGNPTTSSWGLDWDSSQDVVSITDTGSVL